MRIAIVNDLALASEALRQVVVSIPDCRLAWMARDGAEAVQRCRQDTPDLILMDLIMPVMDGPEAIRQIMAATPCAILVVTASIESRSGLIFEALGAGALDVTQTPILGMSGRADGASALRFKIGVMSKLIGEHSNRSERRPEDLSTYPARNVKQRLIAIGSSAGGPAALATILGALPKTLPAAILVVQHIELEFVRQMADWLNQQSSLPVRVAVNGEPPENGVVLLAGTGQHLVMTDSTSVAYTAEPRDSIHCPSVDVLFGSIARHWKGEGLGIILTGMGRDGARGLKAMRDAGFRTIAQDQKSCIVYGMPKAAVEEGGAELVINLEAIPETIVRIFDSRSKRFAG